MCCTPDLSFWLHYRDAHDFPGLKVTIDSPFPYIQSATLAKNPDRHIHTPVRGPVGTIGLAAQASRR